MKFLENGKLESLCFALARSKAECLLEARLETYSCKMIAQEKRAFKELLQAEGPGSTPKDLQPLSLPDAEETMLYSTSPSCSRYFRSTSSESEVDTDNAASDLRDSISRKTLFHLVSTLNASFPAYDFTHAKGEDFSRVPSVEVSIKAINMQLAASVPSFEKLKTRLWEAIDEKIDLKNCCVYKYLSNYRSDPYSEDGCIWSFNYFFYNRHLKRVLFFSCRAFKYYFFVNNPLDVNPSGDHDLQWMMD